MMRMNVSCNNQRPYFNILKIKKANIINTNIRKYSQNIKSRLNCRIDNEPKVELKNGIPITGPDLSVEFNGLKLPNPFFIGSGPPGTNYKVMKRALDEGWGGIICKTLTLDASKVTNVTPRHI